MLKTINSAALIALAADSPTLNLTHQYTSTIHSISGVITVKTVTKNRINRLIRRLYKHGQCVLALHGGFNSFIMHYKYKGLTFVIAADIAKTYVSVYKDNAKLGVLCA